jgi:hypothetical protein
MSAPNTSEVVRTILNKHPNLDMEDIVKRAKARGVTSPDKSIRTTVYNEKKKLRDAALVAPAAARTTTPASEPAASTTSPSAKTAISVAPATGGLAGVFANVAHVNKVVDLSGGVENARAVAEAVRACGSVDEFLQHLDLVAGIRSDKSA